MQAGSLHLQQSAHPYIKVRWLHREGGCIGKVVASHDEVAMLQDRILAVAEQH